MENQMMLMENSNNQNNQMRVTSIEELKKYSVGEIIQLPDFAEGQPFYARLKRPSMMFLAKSGKIPNELLKEANNLFTTGSVTGMGLKADKVDEETLSKMFSLFDVICEAAFVEPKYKDLKENDIELTDEQYMAVFNYTQAGVKSLANFRE